MTGKTASGFVPPGRQWTRRGERVFSQMWSRSSRGSLGKKMNLGSLSSCNLAGSAVGGVKSVEVDICEVILGAAD